MKSSLFLSVCTSIACILSSGVFASSPSEELVQKAGNSFICVFEDDVAASQVSSLAKGLIENQGGLVKHNYTTVIKGFSATMSETAANKIAENNPNIAYCEPDGLASGDGQSGGKGGKDNGSGNHVPQITPQGITMVGGPVDVTGMGLTAWIIDSGIDLDHPDLNVDSSRGAGFVEGKGKKFTFDDVHGHGTHVAGTLAAIDNDIDVVGIAAGATVVPVRVLDENNWGLFSDIIAGIDYVASVAQPGDVANMSIWATEHHAALHQAAIGLANVIPFVVISGNDGLDINVEPSEPAHVEHPNLYTVSAVDFNGNFANFSNYGFLDSPSCLASRPYDCAAVDIAAPGKDVTSLWPGGGLVTWWGTSMAAPHVAGVILLLGGNAPTTQGVAANDPDTQADPIVSY